MDLIQVMSNKLIVTIPTSKIDHILISERFSNNGAYTEYEIITGLGNHFPISKDTYDAIMDIFCPIVF
jgi:hypothetical protein